MDYCSHYHYFVSYVAPNGVAGQCELTRYEPIDTYDDVMGMREAIKRTNGFDVVIVSFQLLGVS